MIRTHKLHHYEVTYNKIIKGCPKKHFHETLTIVALENGSVKFNMREEFTLSQNMLLCINPYEIHSVFKGDDKQEKLFVLYLDKAWIENLQKEILECSTYQNIENKIESRELFKEFLELCHSFLSDDFLMQKEEKLLLFMSKLLLQHSVKNQIENSSPLAHDIRNFIDQDLDFELTLEEIATSFHIGVYYLIRLFKKEFELTPYQYILSQKLNQAKELLLQGESISQVAYGCGFSDQSHLYKYFKEVFGLSPKEYQESLS